MADTLSNKRYSLVTSLVTEIRNGRGALGLRSGEGVLKLGEKVQNVHASH